MAGDIGAGAAWRQPGPEIKRVFAFLNDLTLALSYFYVYFYRFAVGRL
jgi:hypothetical protein